MREAEVEPAAVDLERRAERVLGHHRAFDVPTRPAGSPGRLPGRVLAGLRGLPEREVLRGALERVRLLRLHVREPLPRELTVVRIARDAEIDVAVCRVRVAAFDQLFDELDDVGD